MLHKPDNGLVLWGKGNYMLFYVKKQDFLHIRKRL